MDDIRLTLRGLTQAELEEIFAFPIPPAEVRLRRLVKAIKRGYGFECVSQPEPVSRKAPNQD